METRMETARTEIITPAPTAKVATQQTTGKSRQMTSFYSVLTRVVLQQKHERLSTNK